MSLPFLLEIGSEEIPDWMISRGLDQLAEAVEAILLQNRLNFQTIRKDATPRRLVVSVSELQERRDDESKVEKGPPVSAGEKAKQKFLEKVGGDESGLCVDEIGTRYQYLRVIPGRPTGEILAESLPAAILSIRWPKAMYWNGKGSERFIRPIRWLVALLGTSVVPFEIGGVHSGNTTVGHRLLGKRSILVTGDDFDEQLRANRVILSAEERRTKIETEIASILNGKNLHFKPDLYILNTLVYNTEFPTPIFGTFDRQYLELPPEVLVTVMRHHQKYFSVEGADGKLAPHFIAVMNTNADTEGLVRQGHERVLRARFNDARFFWQVDMKRKLEDRLPDLANITFQAKLGSYLDKTNRLETLALALGGKVNVFIEAVQRAARLCKCDLTTDMVKEFTDLQGIMGGLYAREQGETIETALAIYHQYRPLSMDDPIPPTDEGRIVALADKIDTLRECFRVGLVPSGSKDPFALRRAAQGVVRICVEGKLDFWFQDLVAGDEQLQDFILDRIRHYFRDVRGFNYDEVNAVLAGDMRDLPDIESRLSAVKQVRGTENFEPIATSFKRIRNILQQAKFDPIGNPSPELLEPGPEKDLYQAYLPLRAQVFLFATQKQYIQALEAIASLRPKVDLFFDKVLVNAPDEAVRRNRLTLLHNLLTEFSTIADFSEIVTERQAS